MHVTQHTQQIATRTEQTNVFSSALERSETNVTGGLKQNIQLMC